MTGPARLADVLQRARDHDASQFVTQAEVIATPGAGMVTVDLDGPQTWPHIGSYGPVVGHVVVLAGGPGWWVCLGSPSGTAAGGGGGAPAAHSHAEGDVNGLIADLAALTGALTGKVDTGDARLGDARPWTLHSGSPSAGQVPTWSSTTSRYEPATPATGGSGGTVDSPVRAALFAGAARTQTPVVEAQLTTAYTGLAAGDYFMRAQMTVVEDTDAMWSTAFDFLRVVLPVAGRWDVEWFVHSSATTGLAAAKVLLNVPNATAVQTAVTQRSVMTATGFPGGEGNPVQIRRSRRFAANDTLAFALYSSVAFGLPVDVFGGIRTGITVRWAGPK